MCIIFKRLLWIPYLLGFVFVQFDFVSGLYFQCKISLACSIFTRSLCLDKYRSVGCLKLIKFFCTFLLTFIKFKINFWKVGKLSENSSFNPCICEVIHCCKKKMFLLHNQESQSKVTKLLITCRTIFYRALLFSQLYFVINLHHV